MAKVDGTFLAHLMPDGTVQMQIVPSGGSGSTRAPVAKTIAIAERDFVSFFEFTPEKAKAHIAELTKNKHINIGISVDEEKLASLSVQQDTKGR